MKLTRKDIAIYLIAILIISILGFMTAGLQDAMTAKGGRLGTSETASWVQALSSFVAICAGFVIASVQSANAEKLAKRERAEADDERLTSAFTVAAYAHQIAIEAIDDMLDPAKILGYLEVSSYHLDFDGAEAALAAIPLHNLRSTVMVGAILAMKRSVHVLRFITENARRDPGFMNSDYRDLHAEVLTFKAIEQDAFHEIVAVVEQGRVVLRNI